MYVNIVEYMVLCCMYVHDQNVGRKNQKAERERKNEGKKGELLLCQEDDDENKTALLWLNKLLISSYFRSTKL